MTKENLKIATGRRAEILLHFASQSSKTDVRPNEILNNLWGGYSELYEILVLTFNEDNITESQKTLIDDMIKSVSDIGGALDIVNVGSGYFEIEFWGGKKLTEKSLEIVFEFLEKNKIPHYFTWRLTSTGWNIFSAYETIAEHFGNFKIK